MSLFALLLAWALLSSENSVNGDTIFDVMKYGAKGDGRTDDTEAFRRVFAMACNSGYSSAPRILIPGGRKFVVHPTDVKGPCTPKYMSVQLDGRIIQHEVARVQGVQWVTFRGINNLKIWGKGGIEGGGPRLWGYKGQEHGELEEERERSELDQVHYEENKNKDDMPTQIDAGERATNVAFFECNHLRIDGVSTSYSAKNHISISSCEDVVISNIHITSPSTSKNTDGIDISHSRGVTIRDSHIETGDDCIEINSGTSNVNISNVYCGPGHGISIGSFERREADVQNVQVQHCTFSGTTNGARIKTFSDGIGGYVRGITFQDITLQNVKRPIIIDQFYTDIGTNAHLQDVVDISDVKFIGFRGTCSDDLAIYFNCRNGPGCNRITMRDVNIRGSRGQPVRAECHNAHGTAQSVLPRVDCLNGLVTDNVNGEGGYTEDMNN